MRKIKPKKIIFLVQQYKPNREAISNEIKQVADHLEKEGWKVKIHDLHLRSLFRFRFNRRLISYHFAFYPLTFIFVYLYSLFFDVRHIYTSLCDTPYLPIINKRPLLLTAAAPYRFSKLKKRIKRLKKVSLLILESEIQQKQLEYLLNSSKKNNQSIKKILKSSKVIYPGVDLKQFYHQRPVHKDNKFTILFASNPGNPKKFKQRGIYLLLDTAQKCERKVQYKNIQFDFAWRAETYFNVKDLIVKKNIKNIKITSNFVKDMNQRYADAHCTIIPYTKRGDFVKLIPNSAIESLAAGKPVLCSSKSGVANIIKENQVGIVFEPTTESLLQAVKELRKNYHFYQKNCRKTAQRLFSKNILISKYDNILHKLLKERRKT